MNRAPRTRKMPWLDPVPVLGPPLEPADRVRCQCEITPAHGPFRLGPRPRPERCPRPTRWIAYERQPDEDGRVGAMGLCDTCTPQLKKSPQGPTTRLAVVPRSRQENRHE